MDLIRASCPAMFCFRVASAAVNRFFASSIAYIASSSFPSSSSISFWTFWISCPRAWYSSFFLTESCWVWYLPRWVSAEPISVSRSFFFDSNSRTSPFAASMAAFSAAILCSTAAISRGTAFICASTPSLFVSRSCRIRSFSIVGLGMDPPVCIRKNRGQSHPRKWR